MRRQNPARTYLSRERPAPKVVAFLAGVGCFAAMFPLVFLPSFVFVPIRFFGLTSRFLLLLVAMAVAFLYGIWRHARAYPQRGWLALGYTLALLAVTRAFDLTGFLVVPISLVPLAMFLVGVYTACYVWGVPVRPTPGAACEACAYDLTGNTTGVCPECGQHAPSSPGSQVSK